jgi:hypothetical protein
MTHLDAVLGLLPLRRSYDLFRVRYLRSSATKS